MTNATMQLVLGELGVIEASLNRTRGHLDDMSISLTAIEGHIGRIGAELADLGMSADRLDRRIGRIERRLDVIEV